MQRIANLLMFKNDHVLLLKKPRRGWYVAPGGKMIVGESIYEAAIREFTEETGLTPIQPKLKGVYTMLITDADDGVVKDEWMLYTFLAHDFKGELLKSTIEGVLEWHPLQNLNALPMAEGDRTNLLFAATQRGMQYGTFFYTEEFELLQEKIQKSGEGDE